MARKRFHQHGKAYWEENRRQRNNVVAVRKESLKNYFAKHCAKHDKSFWKTISPFFSNKKQKSNDIILQENGKTVVNKHDVTEIFNDYFANVASSIGFFDKINSTTDAISKHEHHPSVVK